MLKRLFYEKHYTQTGQFLREFEESLLFIFAKLSLILSAMQVVLTAQPNNLWPRFASVSARFSVTVIIMLVAVIFSLLLVVVMTLTLQIEFDLRSRRNRDR
jgi:ABC-type multidrug transport system permease subunit